MLKGVILGMLFTLMQVNGMLTVIRRVPEAHMERRSTLIIAFGNKLCTDMGNKLCNFLLVWIGFVPQGVLA